MSNALRFYCISSLADRTSVLTLIHLGLVLIFCTFMALVSACSKCKKFYTRHEVALYSALNLVHSSLELFIFSFFDPVYRFSRNRGKLIFVGICLFRCLMALVLHFSRRRAHARMCQAWCMSEAGLILVIVTIALTNTVKLSRFGIAIVFLSLIFKLYGLWVVYYFSLDVQSDNTQYIGTSLKNVSLAKNEDTNCEVSNDIILASAYDNDATATVDYYTVAAPASSPISMSPDNEVQYSVIYV